MRASPNFPPWQASLMMFKI